MVPETQEPQYQEIIKHFQEEGTENLGLMLSHTWCKDPKRLAFVLSRYKFVAKMFANPIHRVLEVGCSSGFPSRVVRQTVGSLMAIDMDPIFIDEAKLLCSRFWPITFKVHNILQAPLPTIPAWDGHKSAEIISFHAAYALDVLEHIPIEQESKFFENICKCLLDDSQMIIGMPSLESQVHASEQSKQGHVNCKTQNQLQKVMERYFRRVNMFSMNDETLHVGFASMSHYIFGLGTCKR